MEITAIDTFVVDAGWSLRPLVPTKPRGHHED